jgi:predicted dehydrogenase
LTPRYAARDVKGRTAEFRVTPIRIGIVGAGWMGNSHAAAYRRLQELWPETDADVAVTVIADTNATAAEATARRFGIPRWTTDWREVIEDPTVQVVDVTGPNDMHAEVTIAAARAGKAVSCEKPLARDLAESRKIAHEVGRAGVLSQVGFCYRLVPSVQYARQLVRRGELGDIRHVRAWFLCDFGATAATPFSWRYDREIAGTGVIGDLGSHVIEMAEGLAGPIASLAARHSRYVDARPDPGLSTSHFATGDMGSHQLRAVTNEDSFVAAAQFANGALGTLEASRVARGPRASLGFEVYGSQGAVSWDLERMNEVHIFDASDDPARWGFRRVVSGPEHPDFSPLSPGAGVGLSWQDLKTIEAHHLVGQLRGTRSPEASVAQALRVAVVLDAIGRSAADGAWVTVDQDAQDA